ncbi:FAS1-like dehydratase domain-containing protein [Mycobacterium sp. C31M]
MSLDRYIQDWNPTPLSSTEVVDADIAARFAVTLDLDITVADGDPLPPMWHWFYFTEFPPTADLGADGHPRDGHFLPPIPHRRRMFAGARLQIHEPMRLGQSATRRSEVVTTKVKQGKTGELLFVTVRNEFSQDDRVHMTEEQDLVYRSDSGAATPFVKVDDPLEAPRTPWVSEPKTHPALLFRFSALTANAHRIHYDQQYTTTVEGFPGLVVHGPLLALYMSELARTQSDRPLQSFDFRLSKPVFVGDPIRAQGTPAAGGDTAELSVISGAGTVHATATAGYL